MGIVVIQGGPGTGKTRTLTEMRREAVTRGALCLAVSGFHDEHSVRFATLSQFIHAPGATQGLKEALVQLMDRAALAAPVDQIPARMLREVVAELTACAARQPLVILVDDAHQTDPASQWCLLHIIRRIEFHDITVALAFPPTGHGALLDPLELAAHGARMIRTSVLGEDAIAELLVELTGSAAAGDLAPYVHAVTGGNPALVTALAHDLAQAEKLWFYQAVPLGENFRAAFLGRLVRHPQLAACVEAIAVLGAHASVELVAGTLETCPLLTGAHCKELEAAGLLAGAAFRHPDIRDFVLRSMSGGRLRLLHRRAAEQLLAEDAPAMVVAGYLLVSGHTPDTTEAHVLMRAAHQLLCEDRALEAVSYLRLAEQAHLDDCVHHEISLDLTIALWWVNPVTAHAEVTRLVATARAGRLPCLAMRGLALWFLWHQQPKRAQETLTLMAEQCGPEHPTHIGRFSVLISMLRPELVGSLGLAGTHQRAAEETAGPLGPARPHGQIADVTAGELYEQANPWRSWNNGFMNLLVLIAEADTERASRLCAELLDRIPQSALPTRVALLTAVRAHLAWCVGDLVAARVHATAALEALPDHSWGIAIGLPLSVLVNVHTAEGDLDLAARRLEHPVPPRMQGSYFGAMYHLARGRRLLAAGQPREALDAFLHCAPPADSGAHARGFHQLGWQASAAEAYLAIGDPEGARRAARAALTALGPRPTAARGHTLTVLGLIDAPELRRTHLEEAEQVLRTCGNRLALARALLRLSWLDLSEGLTAEARAHRDEGLDLTRRCGVPEQALMPFTPERPHAEPALPPLESAAPAGLSEAEWRVASLAAEGKSNRQIAKELYVTMSTVEQHLTRVYRKLGTRRRSELSSLLPSRWESGLAESR